MLTASILYQHRERERVEDFQKHKELLVKAKRELELSDHLLYVTYPLISELKFLLSITEHIISSLSYAVEAMLEYERIYKRLDPYPRNFRAMIDVLEEGVAKTYGFDNDTKRFLKRMAELKHFIENSTLQFKRQNAFILTNDEYSIRKIDLQAVKGQLLHAKEFISRVEGKICQKS
jgi:hypothetical protein